MLINLSNHPSERWSNQQLHAANEQFGIVLDIPFPKIDPAANRDQLLQLTANYCAKIIELKKENKDQLTVHIMGEMNFTYLMVYTLTTLEVPCVASTTNRIVEEKDGKKIVQFQFVQFRSY